MSSRAIREPLGTSAESGANFQERNLFISAASIGIGQASLATRSNVEVTARSFRPLSRCTLERVGRGKKKLKKNYATGPELDTYIRTQL